MYTNFAKALHRNTLDQIFSNSNGSPHEASAAKWKLERSPTIGVRWFSSASRRGRNTYAGKFLKQIGLRTGWPADFAHGSAVTATGIAARKQPTNSCRLPDWVETCTALGLKYLSKEGAAQKWNLTMPVKANPLANVFRVLSGARDPEFVFEPELRLFQLKIWLLSDDDDTRSLNDSAALFASIMLRRRIRLDHRRSPKATASELIDTVFKREDYRELYDAAFHRLALPIIFRSIFR